MKGAPAGTGTEIFNESLHRLVLSVVSFCSESFTHAQVDMWKLLFIKSQVLILLEQIRTKYNGLPKNSPEQQWIFKKSHSAVTVNVDWPRLL